MSNLPPIEFDGKLVKPKAGRYYCPHKCSQSGYPQPSWKTEKGFRQHMEKCPKGGAFKAVEMEKREQEAADKAAFVAAHPYKYRVGDIVYFVRQVTVKPSRDSRGCRLRYEDVYRFSGSALQVFRQGAVMAYGSIVACYYNEYEMVLERDCLPDQQTADIRAAEQQAAHDEHLRFSAFCR